MDDGENENSRDKKNKKEEDMNSSFENECLIY
jgi:hypothetical protein